VPLLLNKGYRVTVYDLFNFGGESLLQCTFNPDLVIVKGDVRDEQALKQALHDANVVVHLAAIVGYPACSKDPQAATDINVQGTRNLINNLRPDQKLVFSSTGSCYGAILDGYCTEETPLSPLSLYGSSKVEGEKLTQTVNGVILRLATIFGVSQRMRLDLLINDLVNKALNEKEFEVYEAHFRRTFLHVRDVARAFVFAIENYETMSGRVFNVGGDNLNFTKMQICDIIKEMIPTCKITPSEFGQDADKRDYQVSYEKIRKLGFVPEISVHEGIAELLKILPILSPEFLAKTKNV
jgi:nucleoside-diphosphate-sugar epimerase